MDFLIVRENTEGLYSGNETMENPEKDNAKAMKYFRLAANGGNPDAKMFLDMLN